MTADTTEGQTIDSPKSGVEIKPDDPKSDPHKDYESEGNSLVEQTRASTEDQLEQKVGADVLKQAQTGDADAVERAVSQTGDNKTLIDLLFEMLKSFFKFDSVSDLRDRPSFMPSEEETKELEAKEKPVKSPEVAQSPLEDVTTLRLRDSQKRGKHAIETIRQQNWMPIITKASQKHEIPAPVIIAIIEAESACNPRAEAKTSSAKGLCQAIDGTWEQYREALASRMDSQLPAGDADRHDPKYAIDFIAWYCKHLEGTVNGKIRTAGLSTTYELHRDRPELYYMAYHDGPKGYVQLAKYLEGRVSESELVWFQRRTHAYKGTQYKAYEFISAYALRVKDMARVIEGAL